MTTHPSDLSVPMTDGASMSLRRYSAPASPSPAVFLMVPYRKESAGIVQLASLVNRAGYEFVIADVRGFGGSSARYQGLLSEREIQDGVELIEWLATQPFCNGQVAMMGGSYFGANQVLIAARRPPALRCIAPFVNFVDTYRDMTHRGGIPSHTNWGAMTYLRSQQATTARQGLEQFYLDLMLDPLDNSAHQARSPESVLSQVTVPTLCLGGWHDYFLRGTVRTYLGVQGPKRLVIGPWGHGGFGPDHEAELLAWLGYWLDGRGEDPTRADRVRLYDTGSESWRTYEDWSAPSSRRWTTWHPHAVGTLEAPAPAAPTPLRVLTHLEATLPAPNPKPQYSPDPTDAGMGHWGEDTVFDTAPFPEECLVEGPLCLHAVVRSDECTDLDLHARVSVVRGSGPAMQLTEGRLRASHRAVEAASSATIADGTVVIPWHRHDAEELIRPGQPVELIVEIPPVCHRVAAGERLRLGLTLVRADEGSTAASASLESGSRLLVPVAP